MTQKKRTDLALKRAERTMKAMEKKHAKDVVKYGHKAYLVLKEVQTALKKVEGLMCEFPYIKWPPSEEW